MSFKSTSRSGAAHVAFDHGNGVASSASEIPGLEPADSSFTSSAPRAPMRPGLGYGARSI